MEKNVKTRTITVIFDELKSTVDKYNLATEVAEKLKIDAECKALVQEYNSLSLLNVYAACMKDKKPLVKFAKTFYYDTVNVADKAVEDVVDNVKKIIVTRSVNESSKELDFTKFIEWAHDRNKNITVSKDWKVKKEAARATIVNEWKKYNESENGYEISKTAVKKAVQAMFDALVHIESATGKNAVIADKAIANYVICLAQEVKKSKDSNAKPQFDVKVLSPKNWNSKAFDILHMAVEGKSYEVEYCKDEDVTDEPAAEKTETKKSTGKKK